MLKRFGHVLINTEHIAAMTFESSVYQICMLGEHGPTVSYTFSPGGVGYNDAKAFFDSHFAETPEPEIVEEWPKRGDRHLYLAMDGIAEMDGGFGQLSEDERLLAVGNIFHPDTRLNQYGVHIDDVRKLFLLSLKSKYFAQVCLSTLRHQEPIQFQAPAWDPERALLAEIDGEPRES